MKKYGIINDDGESSHVEEEKIPMTKPITINSTNGSNYVISSSSSNNDSNIDLSSLSQLQPPLESEVSVKIKKYLFFEASQISTIFFSIASKEK
ncbi:10244_t:CDS:2 [Entrophospora sp. SA101]|nr:10244_t:CDS:2 [Entrophospora sp. SA101]